MKIYKKYETLINKLISSSKEEDFIWEIIDDNSFYINWLTSDKKSFYFLVQKFHRNPLHKDDDDCKYVFIIENTQTRKTLLKINSIDNIEFKNLLSELYQVASDSYYNNNSDEIDDLINKL